MIGYLRRHEQYSERLRIGPDENELSEIPEADVAYGLPLLGLFSIIGDRRVLFYRWNGELRLRIGNALPISLMGLHANCRHKRRKTGIFTLKAGDKLLWEQTYLLSEDFRFMPFAPTQWEPEDSDLYLFLTNVLGDPDWANRIWRVGDDRTP